MSDLSEHIVFTARIAHFAVLDVLWDPFVFTPLFGHCFSALSQLLNKKTRMVANMDDDSMHKNVSNSTLSPKSPHEAPRRSRAFQMMPECYPKVPKWCPGHSKFSENEPTAPKGRPIIKRQFFGTSASSHLGTHFDTCSPKDEKKSKMQAFGGEL